MRISLFCYLLSFTYYLTQSYKTVVKFIPNKILLTKFKQQKTKYFKIITSILNNDSLYQIIVKNHTSIKPY